MVPLLYLSAFGAVFFLVLAFAKVIFAGRTQVRERLERVREVDEEEDPLRLPFARRVLRPLVESVQERIMRLAPAELRRSLENLIHYAGQPWHLNFHLLTALQMSLAIMFPLTIFALFQARGTAADPLGAGYYILLFFGGFFLPLILVKIRADRRQEEIRKALPEMLDLLLVSVEAGQGFDQALKYVVEKLPGELSREMHRFLEEVRMGRPRTEALWSLAARNGVPELRLFVTSIIQAEQRWGNIAGAVGAQAEDLRRKRRKWAEEEARKAPVKMLFPLFFFMFPALMVILLGPAVFALIRAFAEMGR